MKIYSGRYRSYCSAGKWKKRGEIEVAKGLSQNEVEAAAMKIDNVSKSINSEIRKIIYVPNRILNVVI